MDAPRPGAPPRERILHQYGPFCTIQEVRRTPRFQSSLFVVDLMQGGRLTRILGAIGKSGQLTEQSGMDLLHPERLVFLYERLMLLALALAGEAKSVLLLGLGGGAMWRHLQAYLPQLRVNVVERDPVIVDLARRFFHITRAVRHADAQEMVADAPRRYDAILADLYDGRGMERFEAGFWRDCAEALKPGGCLAVNWAAFVDDQIARREARAIAEAFGRSFFIGPRKLDENVVQLAPLDERVRLGDVAARWRRFAHAHRLPREDREALKGCTLTERYPMKAVG